METSAYATLLLGFALGLKHATDADHIVAVSTLVSEAPGVHSGARVGALWGLGHLLTVFAVGSAVVMLRVTVSPRVQWALELGVALLLIWLGTRTVYQCLAGSAHFHMHEHGGLSHAHLHFHGRGDVHHEHATHAGVFTTRGAHAGVKPLLIGMAHGLAGTAALALLVLTSIPSRRLSILYLLVFGLGALTGMVAFSALLGIPLARARRRLQPGHETRSGLPWLKAMRLVAGTCCSLLGVFLTWRAFLPQFRPF